MKNANAWVAIGVFIMMIVGMWFFPEETMKEKELKIIDMMEDFDKRISLLEDK